MENLQLHNPDNPCHQKSVSDRKFVIFDLDGTLIDSFECVLRCVNKTLGLYSLPKIKILPSEREVGNIEIIFKKAKEFIKGEQSFFDFKKCFDKIHFDDCIETVSINLNIYAELIHHKNNGVGIIILTNKYQSIAEKICKQILMLEDAIIIGRKDAMPLKDDCNKVANALYNYQITMDCILCYYGDSSEDMNIANKLKIDYYKYENSIYK